MTEKRFSCTWVNAEVMKHRFICQVMRDNQLAAQVTMFAEPGLLIIQFSTNLTLVKEEDDLVDHWSISSTIWMKNLGELK